MEMLASFSLGGITPFHQADAEGRLKVHRFRSVWSAEGRHECRSIEELHLERSWSGAGAFSERFGQLGTMPVRTWFPFVAVEDTVPGVVWGAQHAWAGSWQMEIFRQHDDVCLSGGLADREVPELVLQDDGHLVGILRQQVVGARDSGRVGLEGQRARTAITDIGARRNPAPPSESSPPTDPSSSPPPRRARWPAAAPRS